MTEHTAMPVNNMQKMMMLAAEAGVLAALLLNQGIISEKQLNYALRVRKKIATPQTMLDTLIELGYVDRDQVKESLRNSQINIRLGDLLVELGYLSDADLRQALGLQKESGGKKRLGRTDSD